MNLIIIEGKVFKLNKKDFQLAEKFQEDIKLSEKSPVGFNQETIEKFVSYINQKYKIIQVNPPVFMF